MTMECNEVLMNSLTTGLNNQKCKKLIGLSISEHHTNAESRMVVHVWKNGGDDEDETRPAPH